MNLGEPARQLCKRLPMEHTTSECVYCLYISQVLISPPSQLLNEIMPMIYKRFTEKAAEEWRQIYKGLQLLEFLIKNGSERVIDDARSHLTLLKMLRQFHYIDQNGKDQGLNVRNRAKELAELLSDVDRIRAERKKARATRNKYTGVEGGAGLGGGFSSGGGNSRYGGFGSEEAGYGGYSGGVYGDGGGFGGQTSDFQDSGSRSDSAAGRRDRFEEYDEYDEGAVAAPGNRQADTSSSSRKKTTERAAAKKPETPKKKAPEVDLFSFDDPIPTSSASVAAPLSSHTADDDDFDDFQSATPSVQTAAPIFSPLSPPTATTTSATQYAAPQPVSAPKAANLNDMVGFSSISPATSATATPVNYSAFSPPAVAPPRQAPAPTAYQGSQPNYFTSVQAAPISQAKPTLGASSVKSPGTAGAKPSGDAFGSIWSSASAGIKKTSTPTSGPALGQLAKEKASAGIWGASSSASSTPYQGQKPASGQPQLGGGLDDLLG